MGQLAPEAICLGAFWSVNEPATSAFADAFEEAEEGWAHTESENRAMSEGRANRSKCMRALRRVLPCLLSLALAFGLSFPAHQACASPQTCDAEDHENGVLTNLVVHVLSGGKLREVLGSLADGPTGESIVLEYGEAVEFASAPEWNGDAENAIASFAEWEVDGKSTDGETIEVKNDNRGDESEDVEVTCTIIASGEGKRYLNKGLNVTIDEDLGNARSVTFMVTMKPKEPESDQGSGKKQGREKTESASSDEWRRSLLIEEDLYKDDSDFQSGYLLVDGYIVRSALSESSEAQGGSEGGADEGGSESASGTKMGKERDPLEYLSGGEFYSEDFEASPERVKCRMKSRENGLVTIVGEGMRLEDLLHKAGIANLDAIEEIMFVFWDDSFGNDDSITFKWSDLADKDPLVAARSCAFKGDYDVADRDDVPLSSATHYRIMFDDPTGAIASNADWLRYIGSIIVNPGKENEYYASLIGGGSSGSSKKADTQKSKNQKKGRTNEAPKSKEGKDEEPQEDNYVQPPASVSRPDTEVAQFGRPTAIAVEEPHNVSVEENAGILVESAVGAADGTGVAAALDEDGIRLRSIEPIVVDARWQKYFDSSLRAQHARSLEGNPYFPLTLLVGFGSVGVGVFDKLRSFRRQLGK